MYIFLILAIAFAALQAYATNKEILKLEYIAKPAVMILLFIWLYAATGLQGAALWFGTGILFSLVGDILLLQLERMFIYGLIAFLFTHVSYIIGFKSEFASISAWSFLLVVILGISAILIVRRIVSAMRGKGQTQFIVPVILYSTTISMMLYAAIITLLDVNWKTNVSLLVAAGASCFTFPISCSPGINSSRLSKTEGYLISRFINWDKYCLFRE